MAAFISRRGGAALFLLGLLIGFARVYGGIHYPGDIAAGLLAAILGVGIAMVLSRALPGDRAGHSRPATTPRPAAATTESAPTTGRR